MESRKAKETPAVLCLSNMYIAVQRLLLIASTVPESRSDESYGSRKQLDIRQHTLQSVSLAQLPEQSSEEGAGQRRIEQSFLEQTQRQQTSQKLPLVDHGTLSGKVRTFTVESIGVHAIPTMEETNKPTEVIG